MCALLRAVSHPRSEGSRKLAVAGESASVMRSQTPKATVGRPCSRRNGCVRARDCQRPHRADPSGQLPGQPRRVTGRRATATPSVDAGDHAHARRIFIFFNVLVGPVRDPSSGGLGWGGHLRQKQPLPAVQAEEAVHGQQRRRQRGAHHLLRPHTPPPHSQCAQHRVWHTHGSTPTSTIC